MSFNQLNSHFNNNLKTLLTLLSLAFSVQSFAVDKVVISNPKDPALKDWFSAYYPSAEGDPFIPYSQAKQMLFLAEGFKEGDSKLAETASTLCGEDCKVFKTSLDCPEELNGKTEGKITYLKIDTTSDRDLESLKDDQFDTVAMKRGLCPCTPDIVTTCCGISYGTDISKRCFDKIVRLLNKENPNSVAYLEGMFRSKFTKTLSSLFKLEKKAEKDLENDLREVEEKHKNVKIDMVYFNMPAGAVMAEYEAEFEDLLDNDGHPLKKGDELPSIELFAGVKISIRQPNK